MREAQLCSCSNWVVGGHWPHMNQTVHTAWVTVHTADPKLLLLNSAPGKSVPPARYSPPFRSFREAIRSAPVRIWSAPVRDLVCSGLVLVPLCGPLFAPRAVLCLGLQSGSGRKIRECVKYGIAYNTVLRIISIKNTYVVQVELTIGPQVNISGEILLPPLPFHSTLIKNPNTFIKRSSKTESKWY